MTTDAAVDHRRSVDSAVERAEQDAATLARMLTDTQARAQILTSRLAVVDRYVQAAPDVPEQVRRDVHALAMGNTPEPGRD